MPIAVDMKNIAEGIEASYGERVAFLSDLSKDTHETLKMFHHNHQKMSADLGDFLSSDRDNREKVVASLRGKNKKELKAMAEQLAHFLAESTSSMKKDTAELMTQIRGDINVIEKEVASLLSGFDKDLKEARQNWQNLVRIMAAKRTGKAVTVAKKIEGVAKKEVAEAVEAFIDGNLKEKILRLISETASGISLVKMGKALRIHYVRLAKPANELVKEGKIKKEDSEYFKV